MAPEHDLKIRNGPNSDPVKLDMEVNGRINHPKGKNGKISLTVKNDTEVIPFKGSITKFDFDGQGSIWIEGVSFRANEIKGYDTRTGKPSNVGGGSGGGGGSKKPSRPSRPSKPDRGPSITNPPSNAPDDVSLGPVEKSDAYGGGAWHGMPDGTQEPQVGTVARYEHSVEPFTIEVDANEPGEFQAAVNLLPKEIRHRVNIVLSDGRHTGNGSAVHTGIIRCKPTGRLEIRSASRNRGKCVSDSGINAIFLGKQEHIRIEDIDFRNLSQFSGPAKIDGCAFAGFNKPGANAASTAAISGKNAHVWMKNCLIGSRTDDAAIHSTIMESYALFNCTLRARGVAIRQPEGSDITIGWGCKMDAPRFSAKHGTIQRGYYRGGERIQ